MSAGIPLSHGRDGINQIAHGLDQQPLGGRLLLIPARQPRAKSHANDTSGKCGGNLHRGATIPLGPAGKLLSGFPLQRMQLFLLIHSTLHMAFETFEKNRMPSKGQPAVTIQKRGALSLNNAAFEAIGAPAFVELLYDRDERLIGIRKSDEDTPHAYAVRGTGINQATRVVSGKAFLSYYDIPRDVARRWTAEERDGMLVIDLKQPGTEVSGHSSRAHEGGG